MSITRTVYLLLASFALKIQGDNFCVYYVLSLYGVKRQ
jgi:hypothetical protein